MTALDKIHQLRIDLWNLSYTQWRTNGMGTRTKNMKIIANLLSVVVMLTLLGCGFTAPKVTPKYEPAMSMEEFNKIQHGMTYEQVTEFVGDPGELVLETGTPGDQFYTVAYYFKGEGSWMNTANARLTFQSGTLISKTQTGLQKKE